MTAVDMRQLALMLALHERQSLNAAALSVHMTPSAASQSLQRLRDALGDELVIRRGPDYVTTPFGETALESFREMLRLWNEASTGSDVFDPATSDAHWVVACAEPFTEIDIDACYASVVSAAPRIRLDIGAVPAGESAWSALRSARVDLLLGCAAPPPEAPDLHALRLVDAQLTHCCLSVTHPRVGATLTLAQYASEPHLALETGEEGGQPDPIDEALAAAGYSPRHQSAVPTLRHLAAIVATTDRLSAVTAHQGAVLARHAEGLRVVPLPAGLPRLQSPRFMTWHHRTHQHPAHRWLRERFRQFIHTEAIADSAGAANDQR